MASFDFAPGINPASWLNNTRVWDTELSNANTGITASDGQRAFLLAIESLDAGLRLLLLGHDWEKWVYTRAYWAIREMTESTPRPYPLLNSESSRLQRHVAELETELKRMAHEDSSVDLTAMRLVLDTSALVRAKCFTEVDWPEYFERKPVRLVIPILVIHELDHLKNTGKSNKARPRLKKIRSILEGHGHGPGDVRSGVTLELLLDPPDHHRLPINDQEIIRRTDNLKGRVGGPLRLVTGDYAMQFTAEADDVPVFFLPDELRLDPDGPSDSVSVLNARQTVGL